MFSPALGRECGTAFEPALRFKPHADSLLHVCQQWGIPAAEAMFVGDSPKDDVRLFGSDRNKSAVVAKSCLRANDVASRPRFTSEC